MGGESIKTFTTTRYEGIELKATFHQSYSGLSKGILIYLHGGGLIYGDRDDLPSIYIDMIKNAGYDLLTLDYLLAPESKLTEIISQLEQSLEWYMQSGFLKLGRPNNRFYLFGRSAGAYLALVLASRNDYSCLDGIISFYGYYNLLDPSFLLASRHYLNYPVLEEAQVQHLIRDTVTTREPIHQRFPLYLYARQSAKWINFLLKKHQKPESYSLDSEQLTNLPPLFLVHAINDPDVPSRQSNRMSQLVQKSTYLKVDSHKHDFDRTDIESLGIDVYNAMFGWLNEIH